jgi:hypothetical protein
LRPPLAIPSEEHQRRVALLDCLARLSGHHRQARVRDGLLRPDVLRRCPGRVFIGEAKHSESPRDADAVLRLTNYLGLASDLSRRGVVVTVAIACRSSRDVLGWLQPMTAPAAVYVMQELEEDTDVLAVRLPTV